MKTVRSGLAGLGLVVLALAAGCGPANVPSSTGAQPPATTGAAAEQNPAPPATTAQVKPTWSATITPGPATSLAPVAIAIISEFTANSVSWTDGKLVPAQTNNVRVEALTGAAHEHSAPLSPGIRYFTFQGANGLQVDGNGNGTVPCSRQDEALLVINNVELSPRLTFDSQGRVDTMAARFHP